MKARGLGCVLVGMYKGFFFFPPLLSLNGLVEGFCVLFSILCIFQSLALCFSLSLGVSLGPSVSFSFFTSRATA